MAEQIITPEQKSSPKVNLGARKVTAWNPTVVVDGRTLSCPHTAYGHESEKAAKRCVASLIFGDAATHPAVAATK